MHFGNLSTTIPLHPWIFCSISISTSLMYYIITRHVYKFNEIFLVTLTLKTSTSEFFTNVSYD